ncbi:PLP-dependent aminotransferase family protein [Paenibacillus sp. JX-17]|uniref:PLP-dependent aminotransferase family protein n=1 Tax=Paenibacillus lacisoli TaxID=3064525 RepID=A0ABT9CDK8_9BACL|nr:PLP-dependent aminotransferase family protein [Paenibacillus sp. JX-17]MDO7907352.1 PLP-dependent aminotransferase family protein [Paenibacillus sp. JX-17]
MKYSFASRTASLLSSPMRLIRENAVRDSFISLAEELPAEELFPIKLLKESVHTVFKAGPEALQYGEYEGYRPLREWLAAEWEQRKYITVHTEHILLTTGSQQAIDLVIRLLVNPGDTVLVENPTSPGCLQVLGAQGARVVGLPSDKDGVLLEALKAGIQSEHPKLFFAAPSFSNPTGSLWSAERRKEVLELCRQAGVLIVEDDSYGDLHFGRRSKNDFTKDYPSLFSLDGAGQGGSVLYIGSFSKTVAPALRIGWAAGPSELIRAMSSLKQMADMQSSTLNQRLLYQLLVESGFDFHNHLALLNREYETRLKLMLELLKRPAWQDASYIMPQGGMYLWVELPGALDSLALLKAALPKGVAFLPGPLCTAGAGGEHFIRLNFSHPGRDELLMGMNLIGESIGEFTARS